MQGVSRFFTILTIFGRIEAHTMYEFMTRPRAHRGVLVKAPYGGRRRLPAVSPPPPHTFYGSDFVVPIPNIAADPPAGSTQLLTTTVGTSEQKAIYRANTTDGVTPPTA